MTNHSAALDRVFHALADPTRRAIVARLCRGPASVGELAKPLSMALLDRSCATCWRVESEPPDPSRKKAGRVRTCHLEPVAFATIERWIGQQRVVWEQRLDRMEAYVKTSPKREPSYGN